MGVPNDERKYLTTCMVSENDERGHDRFALNDVKLRNLLECLFYNPILQEVKLLNL